MLPSLTWSRNWHNKEDNETLSKYAEKCDGMCFLEIGSAEGQSGITMLLSSDNTYIQMVDPFITTNLLSNLKALNLDNRVIIYPTTSELAVLAPSRPVGVLFIDAVHTYEALKHDLTKWSGCNAQYIILHDTSLEPLQKAMNEFILENKMYEVDYVGENITVLSKIKTSQR